MLKYIKQNPSRNIIAFRQNEWLIRQTTVPFYQTRPVFRTPESAFQGTSALIRQHPSKMGSSGGAQYFAQAAIAVRVVCHSLRCVDVHWAWFPALVLKSCVWPILLEQTS